MAVAAGILVEIFLMVLFGGIEIFERFYFDGECAAIPLFVGRECPFDCLIVVGVGVVDACAVLRACVVALTVD